MLERLRARYCGRLGNGEAWALLTHVAASTGSGASRTADAVAMSLWPSRGLELHGFEVKVARSDWLREMRDPSKAEAIARYCDRWWVVAPREVVLAGELPPTWGLLVCHGQGLRAEVEAPRLDAEPIDRRFLAALLRQAARRTSATPAEVAEAREAGYETGRQSAEARAAMLEEQVRGYQASLRVFQTEAGVTWADWRGLGDSERVAAALRTALKGERDLEHLAGRLDRLVRDAEVLGEQAARIRAEHQLPG